MPHAFQREMWILTRKKLKAETRLWRAYAWLERFYRDWPFAFVVFCAGIACVVAAGVFELLFLFSR
jgi:hypothetical protein